MAENKLELVIKTDIDGSDLDLKNMSLTAAKSMLILLESLTSIIEETPGSEEVKIQITEGSGCITAEAPNSIIESMEEDFNSVVEHDCTNSKVVGNWRKIQNLLSANGIEYQVNFIKSGVSTPIYTRIVTSKKFITKSTKVKSDTKIEFITGKLFLNGGINPNLHVIGEKDKYLVHCDELQASTINTFLYKTVFLSTWCKEVGEGKKVYRYCDVYLTENIFNEFKEFINSNEKLGSEAELMAIHYKVKEYVEQDDNFSNLRKLLRLYNHESIEVSVLKTILVATKAFKNNDRVSLLRDSIRRIAEKKRGKTLI